jgi:hypothetical protein
MKDLMRYLISHFSSLFSITGYYNFLKSSGLKIGKDTLFEYLSCLEEVNFIKLVPLFDFSLKRQMVNPKKIYCIDTGLINAVSFQFSENRGRYLENLVFLELLRQKKQIYYFRDNKDNEIDFLIAQDRKPIQLIQVVTSLKEQKAKEREVVPLISSAKELKVEQCLILTEDEKTEINAGKLKIKVLPVWSWLLG